MRDYLDIAEDVIVKADALGIEYTADGRVADRDMAKLLAISAHRARELREEGDAWPRTG